MEPMSHGPEHYEHSTETVTSPRRTGWRAAAAAATGTAAVAGIVVVGLVTGGGTSAASQGAVAQDATTTTIAERPGLEDRKAERTERLSETLQSLVDDGTLTDAQRDAVVEKLIETQGERGPGRGGFGRGGFGGIRGLFGAGLDSAASALGMSADDLKAELQDGKSIADVAGEKNVDIDTVIDALVAEAKAKLAEMDLPEGRTAPTDEQIREAITEAVNGELRFGHRGGPGHGPGDGDGAEPDAPAGDTTTTTEG